MDKTSVMTADGFSMVTKHSKLCARKNRKGIDARFEPSNSAVGVESNLPASEVLARIQMTAEILEKSPWFSSVMDILQDFMLDEVILPKIAPQMS
jgi:hypothetical protein